MSSISISSTPLLKWTLGFFVLALIAGVLGFGGVAGAATGIAQLLFIGFIIVAVLGLIVSVVKR